MAKEMLLHGGDVFLRPVVGPLGTFTEGGRNWEGFSPDPYLSGELVAPTITGIQDQGIVATMKHYLAYEQEHFRLVSEAEVNGFDIAESLSSNVDDRTMHELYLWPFANAVKAGVGATMSSYNQINNSYSSQNSWTLNRLLKSELGYQGFVMSDWGGHHSGVSSIVAGLDMDMPGDIDSLSGKSYWGANLTIAVANGTVPQWRLDDACMRIMAAYYKVGRDKIDIPVNFNSYVVDEYGPIYPYIEGSPIGLINEDIYVRGNHKEIIREIGRASIVMLKNEGALPLTDDWQHYGIFGSDAGPNPFGANGCPYRGCDNGTLAEGWGSGAFLYPYLIDPAMDITNYVTQNTKASISAITEPFQAEEQIEELASLVDTALVFVNSNSGEGAVTVLGNYGDRNNITFWLDGDDLIKQVAGTCNNTIVVMHTVGPVLVSDWYDNPNITAILWAGLPGQESGNSLVDVLWGDYNPSGKLPFTFAKSQADYGRSVMYEPNNGKLAPQQQLTSLNIDYRYFDAEEIEPIYEFGYGLSYTTFEYSDLKVTKLDAAPYRPASGMSKPASTFGGVEMGHYNDLAFPPDNPQYEGYIYPYLTSSNPKIASGDKNYGRLSSEWLPPGYNNASAQPLVPAGGGTGGNPCLWEPLINVSATITNTGKVAGHEAAQLYVALGNGEPPKVLRGFDRVYVEACSRETFQAQLLRRDLSTWDSGRQDWVTVDEVTIYVGASSRDLPLKEVVKLGL